MNYPLQRQPSWNFNPHNLIWIILAMLVFMVLFRGLARADSPPAILTASWYSYKSCRKEGTNGIYTASGERFNENDYTAAMWGVPFNTLVKVTNITNGLSVTVRINDRGPAQRLIKKGRIIDLSKGAFFKLTQGHLEVGIIKVEIYKIKGKE